MTTKPLPSGNPNPGKVHVRRCLEAAHLALEQNQLTLTAALELAQLHTALLMHGKTTPDALLASLRAAHEAITAMIEPAQEMFTQLIEAQMWAERVSWDVLAVPLVATDYRPADVLEQVEALLSTGQGND